MVLRVERLTKLFRGPAGPVRALHDVSFTVDEGEFIAVYGSSGCGKTTLLLSIGALLQPSNGRVVIDGEDPYQLSPEARCRFRADKIGFVFQQFHLVPYLSVLENVLIPSIAKPLSNAKDRAVELVHRFNLEHRKDHVPAMLSTGERQRVAMARALLHEPRVILADEPTGNLDAGNAQVVLQHLAALAEAGRSVLMVTHDESAGAAATRSLRLAEGRVDTGTHDLAETRGGSRQWQKRN